MEMKKFFDEHPDFIFLIIGFSLIFLAVIYAIWISLEWASIIMAIGILIVTWGISLKSGRIISQIANISSESKTTTKDIASANFYETISALRDRRLQLRSRIYKIINKMNYQDYNKSIKRQEERELDKLDLNIYLSFSIWITLDLINRAMIFKKYFVEDDIGVLIHFFDNFLQDLCNGVYYCDMSVNGNYIGHLEKMYNGISDFELFNRELVQDQHRRERILTNLSYLKKITDKFITFDRCVIDPKNLHR